MVNGKVYTEKSDGVAMSKFGAVAGQAADKPTMQKDANRLARAIKAALSGGGLGGDVAAETIENANAAKTGIGKFTRLFGGNKFDDELASAADVENSWMKALGDYTKDRSQWNADRLEVASVMHDIQAERINNAYMNMLARRNLSVGGAGIGATTLGGSAILDKTASAGLVMEKLASVMPYVDYILSSGGMEKSALNAIKLFTSATKAVAPEVAQAAAKAAPATSRMMAGQRGFFGRLGEGVARMFGGGKNIDAYQSAVASVAKQRGMVDSLRTLVRNGDVEGISKMLSEQAAAMGKTMHPDELRQFAQNIARNPQSIEGYLRNSVSSAAADARSLAGAARAEANAYNHAARVGTGVVAGGAGLAGAYGLGHSNGVDSGIEDFKANQLPQYLTRAATIGHMAAQNQANNAGFMDRLGYLFTGNSGSLNMNNPLQRQPSRTTGGFMA